MVNVWAVVVTYNPTEHDLLRLLHTLVGQVDHVVLVNNASSLNIRELASGISTDKIEVTVLSENLGLAAAQNIGLRMAQKNGVPYAILFDQDSLPAPGLVEALLASMIKMRRAGERVAAVGPNHSGAALRPFRRLEGLIIRRCGCTSDRELVPVDFLISSGCLISLDVLPEVGDMDERLFIDYVDVEWGLRAIRHGFRMIGVCAATMEHRIGDESISMFGTAVPMHSPLRHYYAFRNGVWLYKQQSLSLRWKIAGFCNLFLKFWFFLLFARPLDAHFRMMMLGVLHGAIGKLGRLK